MPGEVQIDPRQFSSLIISCLPAAIATPDCMTCIKSAIAAEFEAVKASVIYVTDACEQLKTSVFEIRSEVDNLKLLAHFLPSKN